MAVRHQTNPLHEDEGEIAAMPENRFTLTRRLAVLAFARPGDSRTRRGERVGGRAHGVRREPVLGHGHADQPCHEKGRSGSNPRRRSRASARSSSSRSLAYSHRPAAASSNLGKSTRRPRLLVSRRALPAVPRRPATSRDVGIGEVDQRHEPRQVDAVQDRRPLERLDAQGTTADRSTARGQSQSS
jgi:hypothetical protein